MESLVPYNETVSTEVQFAKALEKYKFDLLHAKSNPHDQDQEQNTADVDDQHFQTQAQSPSPFDIVQKFADIAAANAYSVLPDQLSSNIDDDVYDQDFTNWDLEMKFWRLVENLNYYRVFCYENEVFGKEKEIGELYAILDWLQYHSAGEREHGQILKDQLGNEDENGNGNEEEKLLGTRSKWINTRLSIETGVYDALSGKNSNDQLIQEMDVDAPLRSGMHVDAKDAELDSKNFQAIYKLVVLGEYTDAIEFANETGNHALAVILAGAMSFVEDDDQVMELANEVEGEGNVKPNASPRDKTIWVRLVYKLSKNTNLDPNERLIYSYLSGGDISENLKRASDSYEESINILVRQLLTNSELQKMHLNSFVEFTPPAPQANSMKDILNIVSNSLGSRAAEESRHPVRILMAAIMLDDLDPIISDLNDSTNDNILRILVHASLFLALLRPPQNPEQLNALITLYISKLTENNQTELVPLYLSFILDERDARETYSLILASITDKEQRRKQLEIAKGISQSHQQSPLPLLQSQPSSHSNEDTEMVPIDDVEQDKLVNVLRRTVERVMDETEEYYNPGNEPFAIVDSGSNNDENDSLAAIDQVDLKLSSAVEWFYENKMYKDAILATIIVIRRFLLNGKLQSLKSFAKGKNFKQLINEYNLQNFSNDSGVEYNGSAALPYSFSSSSTTTTKFVPEHEIISEDQKLELMDYQNFVKGLNLISEWKEFNGNPYTGPNVGASLDKTGHVLNNLLDTWLVDLVNKSLNSKKRKENNNNNKGNGNGNGGRNETKKEDGNEEDDYGDDDDDVKLILKQFRSIYVPYIIMELVSIYQNARSLDWKYITLALKLIHSVAEEESNDFLQCFKESGRLNEFLTKIAELSTIACERGVKGLYCL